MKTSEIRTKFLDFFSQREHVVFPSDGLIPQADPSVLFTSAGMNQFKDYFLGIKKGIKRACSCQKCLRTDDLDKVGKTAYHHTFFEMLGNFSFGDYFKKEAILWAYEFVVDILGLDKERIWISVYKEDEESFKIWKDIIGIPKEKIVKLGEDTNFWPSNAPLKGPNGPCGPCSEIFFDKGSSYGCRKSSCSPACDCGRFVEIWNLVFTQYNRVDVNKLEPLPQKNIDTGMGLERIASVLQNKETNFQIDIFQPLISFIKENVGDTQKVNLINAIADHLRAVVVAIAEGIVPSNESRGYVIRKLIRRAQLYSYLLKKRTPYLYKGVYIISEIFKDVYKEIDERKDAISIAIKGEEEKFLNVLDKVQPYLKDVLNKSALKGVVRAEDCFRLYDTFGLPLEILEIFASQQGLKVDIQGFYKMLEERRKVSYSQGKFSKIFPDFKDINLPSTKFIGYSEDRCTSKIIGIYKNGMLTQNICEGEEGEIILTQTVFYAESGGQVADKGTIRRDENIFEVVDVIKKNEIFFHKGKLIKGCLKLNEEVDVCIDTDRRQAIMRAHTSTHLLHAALRKIIGTHIKQAGSLVEEDRLRFDFTHFKALSCEEIDLIEEEVNSKILEDIKVTVKNMPLWEAKSTGALAFFGEKYSEIVRVVEIGSYSKELCGGTHLDSTGKIGVFKIIKEQALQSGVRRIEALVGKKAFNQFVNNNKILNNCMSLLKTNSEQLPQVIGDLLAYIKNLEKNIKEMDKELFKIKLTSGKINFLETSGIKLIFREFKSKKLDILRSYVDIIRKEVKFPVIGCFCSKNQGVLFSLNTSGNINAKSIFDYLCKNFLLKGGGRQDLIQMGTSQDILWEKVFASIRKFVEDEVS